MLNVCGCDEIFYGDSHKIGAYKYIRKCISENKQPHFHLISIDKLKSKMRQSPKEVTFFLALCKKVIDMLEDNVKHIEEHEARRIGGGGGDSSGGVGGNQHLSSSSLSQQVSPNYVLSWNSNELFSVYIDNIVYLPRLKDCEKVFLKLAIYHGQELRQQIDSNKISVDKAVSASLKLNQNILFDVRVKNLNRCAKLCISVHCISKRKRVILLNISYYINI